ncbi:polysaccharide lyase [Kitasatospora sp. NBC_01246]|uniref:polysaccharide lyase n=1 Tax=Kitasatospora sp. NBC_01246 TaxID=2903570 RepID=UPI002E31BCCC|nr:polysaccharide lyase [Kitasatospora sp. NBC_01246]
MGLARNRVCSAALALALGVGPTVSACQGKGHRDHEAATPAGPPVASPAPEGSSSAASAPAAGVFYDGFEQVADNGWKVGVNDLSDGDRQQPLSQLSQRPGSALRQATSPVRDGQHALQATVPHALGSFRSEVARPPVPMGSENWYGFSIYLPQTWQVDQQSTILAQWHAQIGEDAKNQDDDVKNNPPVAVSVKGDHWILELHWNSQGATATGPGSGTHAYTLGAIRTGAWCDFVPHATWSPTGNGLIQLWQDDQQAVNYTGPTEYNNKQGPYFKIGIYRPGWKTKNATQYAQDTLTTGPITVYDDAVRIVQGPATYQDVAPNRP